MNTAINPGKETKTKSLSNSTGRLGGHSAKAFRSKEIRPGDVIWFAPSEKHWHGAASTTTITDLAIQQRVDGKKVDWLKHITEQQYRKG
jgi:hypothetical protein